MRQFLSPQFLFVTALFLGVGLLYARRVSAGKLWLTLAVVMYVVCAVLPTSTVLLTILEDRFPQNDLKGEPVAGFVVLGGSTSTAMTAARQQVSLGGNVERLTEFVKLARLNPKAQLVFTGGIGLLSGAGPTEASVARQFFADIGLDVTRVQFEDQARNTSESAKRTFEMLQPNGQRWVLITSARHMPRAMGLFRTAGWNIEAYPVDYLTIPGPQQTFKLSWPGNLSGFNAAVYEYAGLFVSWLRDDSLTLFPAP